MIRSVFFLVLLFLSSAARGQQYVITTVAGGALPATPVVATAVPIGDPPRVAVDSSGNVYFGSLHAVFKVDRSGALTRVAGNGRSGNSGDGGPATSAQLATPAGIAVDSAGNIYIADQSAQVIRRVAADGTIGTYAGSSSGPARAGFAGDGGPAVDARFHNPAGLALDASGNLYIADFGNSCVRRISTDGVITTVAGNGFAGAGYGGDGGPAADALLNGPQGVVLDGSGNLYIADTFNNRVRRVTPDGTITTAAGTGAAGFSVDDQPAAALALFLPTDVAVDGSGSLYIADYASGRIRIVTGGTMRTVAGSLSGAPLADAEIAISVRLNGPTGVAVDAGGNIFLAEGSVGSGSGLATGDYRIWKVDSRGLFLAYAGNGVNSFSGDGGPAAGALLKLPAGVSVDPQGNVYVADSVNHRIRKISSGGDISTVAGTGVPGFSGDGGQAAAAQLNGPLGVFADAYGDLFIADSGNHRIRKVFPDGTIGTLAGNGNAGYFGDGGPAIQAALHSPSAVIIDDSNTLYVADTLDHRVRKIAKDGTISTLAGNGLAGYAGDGGPGASAQLNSPVDVTEDSAGNVYIADRDNGRIRRVTPAGTITTFAGDGVPCGIDVICVNGDGGQATAARLDSPHGVAVDSAGSVYISDSGHNQVRMVSPNGVITTLAGNGACCYSGDGQPAPAAELNLPWGLALGADGSLYVADTGNDAVRLLQPAASTVFISSLVNGASNLSGPVSPGEIVVIQGAGLGPGLLVPYQPDGGFVGQQTGGTRVLFNGTAAPVLYSSSAQVSAIVPYGLSGASVQIVVQYQNLVSAPVAVPLAATALALFTQDGSGQGQAAATNPGGSVNTADLPAPAGGVITLFATGEGQTAPAGVDGKLASAPLPQPILGVTATIGGLPATVQFAGGAAGYPAGVMQVTAQIPPGIKAGPAVPVELQINGAASPAGVTIAVGPGLP